MHFGHRYGYICYVNDGAECPGSKKSSRLGVYWRSCAAEHRVAVTEDHLEAAMEGIDLASLKRTIKIAIAQGVNAELIAAAEQRAVAVTEMHAARNELMEAIDGFDPVRLQAALDLCEELEMDEYLPDETMDAAIARFTYLDQRKKAQENLADSVEKFDLDVLQANLHAARVAHVHFRFLHMAEDRERQLKRSIASATTEMREACLTRNASRVSEALTAAQVFSPLDATVTKQTADRLAHLQAMDIAVKELMYAMTQMSVDAVVSTLQTARDLDAYPEILKDGDNRVAELTEMKLDAEEHLVAITASHDIEAIHAAILVAERFDSPDRVLLDAAEDRISEIARRGAIKEELLNALQGSDIKRIDEKLAKAIDLGVDEETVRLGSERSHLLHTIEGSRIALESAIAGHSEDNLREALNSARTVGASNPTLEGLAAERLNDFKQRPQVKKELVAAIEGVNLAVLTKTLVIAEDLGVDQPTVALATARAQTLKQMMDDAEQNLRAAMTTRHTDLLRKALDEAIRLYAADQQLQTSAQERLQHLIKADTAADALIPALSGVNLKDLQLHLQVAIENDVSPVILEKAEDRVAELTQMMADAESELRAALRTRSSALITSTSQEAVRLFAADADLLILVDKRLAHLARAESAEDELIPVLVSDDLALVQSKLNTAKEFDVAPEVLKRGEERVEEIKQLIADTQVALAKAVAGKNTQLLKDTLNEATRLNAITADVTNEARARVAELEELDECTEKLLAVLDSDSMSRLRHRLKRAREAGADESILKRGDEAVAALTERKHEARRTLLDLTKSGTDADELEAAIVLAERLHATSHSRISKAKAKLAELRAR